MIRFTEDAPPLATNAVPATNQPEAVATNAPKTANRRDRSAYNAYQRDYMRKQRAAVKK